MNLTKCENAHFYDADKYDRCPHCESMGIVSSSGSTVSPRRNNENSGTQKFLNPWGKIHKKEKKLEEKDEPKTASSQEEHGRAEVKDEEVRSRFVTEDSTQQEGSRQDIQEAEEKVSLSAVIEQAKVDKDDIKTVGYFGNTAGIEPVVGWFVAIEGPAKGISFELITGKNSIGRASTMSVVIVQDNKVSRERHTTVMYEPNGRKFYLLAGESNGMVYLNGEILLENKELQKGDSEQLLKRN